MARIVVLTPNPAIDVTYSVDRQTVGETHRVRSIARLPGGKGVNVSRVLRALGHEAVNLVPLGGTAGEWMSTALRELGMPVVVSPIAEETRTTVAITDGVEHPTLFAEAGPRLSDAEVEALRGLVRSACADARMLVISGSLPPGLAADEVARWVEDARSAGVMTLVDAGGAALLAAARAGADILKPNEGELLDATGLDSVPASLALLRELGARTIIVSRGSAGLVALHGDEILRAPAVADVVGNPTGAGDAATAGVASAVLEGMSMPDTLRRAAALGAAAVLRPAAGEVDLDAYRRFLDESPSHPDSTGDFA